MIELKVLKILILIVLLALLPGAAFSLPAVGSEGALSPSVSESFNSLSSAVPGLVEEGASGNIYSILWVDLISLRWDVKTQAICYSCIAVFKNECCSLIMHFSENNSCRSLHDITFYCRFQTWFLQVYPAFFIWLSFYFLMNKWATRFLKTTRDGDKLCFSNRSSH